MRLCCIRSHIKSQRTKIKTQPSDLPEKADTRAQDRGHRAQFPQFRGALARPPRLSDSARVARRAEVRVFYPNPRYPSLLKPRGRSYSKLAPSSDSPDVKVDFYDYPALPVVSRPLNGWTAAHVLSPHIRSFAPDLIFSYFLYPEGYAALRIGKALSVPVVARSMGSDINRTGDPITAMHTRTVLRESRFPGYG